MVRTFFRHGSNAVIAAGTLAIAALFAARLVPFGLPGAAFVALGALGFFVSEYTTHRFLLHAPPQKHPAVLRVQHRLHYDHHVDPAALELLFLPVWFVVPAAALTFAVAWAASHSIPASLAVLAGALLALFAYEWVHYVAHMPYVPRTRFGRFMKKYHLRHHFKNERLWFGVTNPAMDLVGRTYARVADARRSGSTRILFPKEP